jgi:hypothetical protein
LDAAFLAGLSALFFAQALKLSGSLRAVRRLGEPPPPGAGLVAGGPGPLPGGPGGGPPGAWPAGTAAPGQWGASRPWGPGTPAPDPESPEGLGHPRGTQLLGDASSVPPPPPPIPWMGVEDPEAEGLFGSAVLEETGPEGEDPPAGEAVPPEEGS